MNKSDTTLTNMLSFISHENDSNFHKMIIKRLSECDGRIMSEMFEIAQEYNILKSNKVSNNCLTFDDVIDRIDNYYESHRENHCKRKEAIQESYINECDMSDADAEIDEKISKLLEYNNDLESEDEDPDKYLYEQGFDEEAHDREYGIGKYKDSIFDNL